MRGYIEWSGTFEVCPLIDPNTGKVTYVPYDFKTTRGPTVRFEE